MVLSMTSVAGGVARGDRPEHLVHARTVEEHQHDGVGVMHGVLDAAASRAPRSTSSAALPGVRFQTVNAWPASRMCAAVRRPIRPMPRYATFMVLPLPARCFVNSSNGVVAS